LFFSCYIAEVPCDQLPIPSRTNYYVSSKIDAEKLLLASYQNGTGLGPILLRLAHHIGEGKEKGLIAACAEMAISVKNGNDDTIRTENRLRRIDLSYAEDAARAIILLSCSGTPGEAYNIARGQDFRVEEILRIMANRLGLLPTAKIASTGEEIETYARFSVQKLHSLGFTPCFSFNQTVERFIDWYSQKDGNDNSAVGSDMLFVASGYSHQSSVAA